MLKKFFKNLRRKKAIAENYQVLNMYSVVLFTTMLIVNLISFSVQSQSLNDSLITNRIRLLNQQMEGAFNNNDMLTVAAFYANDAEIVYSNGYTVKGRMKLDSYWGALKDKGRGWKLTVVEIGGSGEFVYQLGQSDLKYISQGKESQSVTNFVLLWRKQENGSYKIFRDYLTNIAFSKN